MYVFCYGVLCFLTFFVRCVQVHIEGAKPYQTCNRNNTLWDPTTKACIRRAWALRTLTRIRAAIGSNQMEFEMQVPGDTKLYSLGSSPKNLNQESLGPQNTKKQYSLGSNTKKLHQESLGPQSTKKQYSLGCNDKKLHQKSLGPQNTNAEKGGKRFK